MSEIHNGIKYFTELQNLVRLGSGISPDASGLERVSETMDVALDPFDYLIQADRQLLARNFLFIVCRSEPAVAGEFGIVAIENKSSNRIVTIDKAWAASSVAGFQARIRNINLAAGVTNVKATTVTISGVVRPSDNRVLAETVSGVPGIECWGGTDAAPFTSASDDTITNVGAGETAQFLVLPQIIRPGRMLLFETVAVNTLLRMGCYGRTRLAMPGELQTIDG